MRSVHYQLPATSTMIRRIMRLLPMLMIMLLSGAVHGQQFSITAGSINSCTGVLEDSGGPNGQYGDNENHTVVICPDTPGDAISLTWVIFNLSTAGLPNNLDRIRIWDGNSNQENFLGEYTGNELQMIVVNATSFNTSGCLTVQFISNDTGVGNFAATITCYTPCERPTAVATTDQPDPIMICLGEVVSFDGSASFPEPGYSIVQYTWDLADGTTADGPTTSHAYTAPGIYNIQLTVLDDNDCANTNTIDVQVMVGTIPHFSASLVEDMSCMGATVELTAVVEPVTWISTPVTASEDTFYLEDAVGVPQTTSMTFTQFPPGSTLGDISDLVSVCVSMEHSFMGDLVIFLDCPNGQSVVFHQQGGGGTNLGIPGPGAAIGTPYDYCWSPTATNGTWVANSGGTLPAGTYSSLEMMDQFLGCPLNGTWTLTFLDLWALDDGHVTGWEINFAPSLFPDAIEFTPELGTSTLDSAGWSGPNVILDPNDPLFATAQAADPGTYEYHFHVTDNFGCTHDTTFSVTIMDLMEVEAGPDIILCLNPKPMAGELIFNPTPGTPPVYSWSPPEGIVAPNNPLSFVFVEEPTWFYLTVHPLGYPQCSVTDSLLVSPDPPIDAGENNTFTICANEPQFMLTDSLAGTPDAGGQWTLNGVPVAPLFDPQTSVSGTYTYTITTAANCTDNAQLEITIIPSADLTCCGLASAGTYSYSCDLTNQLQASPGNTGTGKWTGPQDAVYTNAYAPQTLVTMPAGQGGTHWFFWTEDDGAFCYLIDSVQKTFTDAIVIDIEYTNATCFADCDGLATATVTGGNTVNDFNYIWTAGTGITNAQITNLCAGNYTLTVSDDNGCSKSASLYLEQPPLLQIDQIRQEPVSCSGYCDGQITVTDPEAVEYSFNNGATWTTSAVKDGACEGLHMIKIRNDLGCMGTGGVVVTGPPPVVADFRWDPETPDIEAPTVQFYNSSLSAHTYQWDLGGVWQTDIVSPSFTFSDREPAEYEVCLTAYNMNLCADTMCRVVEVEDMLFIYIPSGFTPNGDDLNDGFKISANKDVISNFRMSIFDRWGRQVFETTDPDTAWLGEHEGSSSGLRTEVFVYMISFDIRATDVRREIMGNITLMR